MFKSFLIERFRGLQRCEITDLRRVTLLTGKNNVGKTAVLEALFVHCGNYNPNLLMIANALRGMTTVSVNNTQPYRGQPWKCFFYDYDDSKPIRLQAEMTLGQKGSEQVAMTLTAVANPSELAQLTTQFRLPLARAGAFGAPSVLKLELSRGTKGRSSGKHYLLFDEKQAIVHPPPPQADHLGRLLLSSTREGSKELADHFAKLQMLGKVDLLVKALQPLEPRLIDLELVFDGEPIIHGNIGLPTRRLIPLPMMGDGLNRVTQLVLAIAQCSDGFVFVDDIDTGLHYSVMKDFWRSVFQAASDFNTQVIATTHSAECAEAASEAAASVSASDVFSLARIERTGARLRTVQYSSDEIRQAFDANLEVR
jgi:hypothetical protein